MLLAEFHPSFPEQSGEVDRHYRQQDQVVRHFHPEHHVADRQL